MLRYALHNRLFRNLFRVGYTYLVACLNTSCLVSCSYPCGVWGSDDLCYPWQSRSRLYLMLFQNH